MNKSNEKGISKVTLILCTIGMILVIILIWSTINNNSKKVGTNANSSLENTQNQFAQGLADGSRLNTSEKLMKDKRIDGLEITNICLKELGGITTLLADVKNVTKSEITEKIITIDILDKSGNKITTARTVINNIASGETKELNASITVDVSNAYDFKVNV